MTAPQTLFAAFVHGLRRAAQYNRADATAPAAILWTNSARQWEPLLPRLRAELPIITLGPYDVVARSGPAIWLRCMVARELPEANWPTEASPIIYLPGISRQELRAVDECPRALQPLAELQYRGVLWTHKNGRDWTIAGFLQAHEDLQIAVASDNETRDALHRALLKLADEPLSSLRVEVPLTAAKLNALLNPEPVRNLLLWINDPAGQKAKQSDAEWAAFRATCQQQFTFDPVTDGEMTAAAMMGGRENVWQGVWNRFAEAPLRYPALPGLLRRARPTKTDALFHQPSSWPQDNEGLESELRTQLAGLKDVLPAVARKQIRELEQKHKERREWVWAELGFAPLACILPALVSLADITETPLAASVPEDIATGYTKSGWKADAAALDALGIKGTPDDVDAVKIAVDALYQPWLRDTAEAFQQAVRNSPIPAQCQSDVAPSKPGCCVLFADGLRYDVGQRLGDALERTGLNVARSWQWVALPGVTPTAKPAVSPVAARLGPGSDFNCVVTGDGAKVTVDTLRRELIKAGYTILANDEIGNPGGAAWTECGTLDATGHNIGWKLALRVPEEIVEIASRVKALLDGGWSEIRVVTDHGWLLLPFGLPKVDLPEHLTEARKGRCARLKPATTTDQQTVPWYWDKNVLMAVPPGICSYIAGKEYDHGGLSPQECVTPILTIRSAAPAKPTATISTVKWSRLRCRIVVVGGSENLAVDIRTKPADASTSIAQAPKLVDAVGQASIAVPDDSHVGEAAIVVLLRPDGTVAAQYATVVGEDR